jgi:hypothetical protein
MARTRTIVGVVNFGARVVAVHTMLLVDWQGLAWQRQIDSVCGGFVAVRRGALMGQSHRGLPSRQWFVDWVDRREEVGFISSVCATGSSFHSVSIPSLKHIVYNVKGRDQFTCVSVIHVRLRPLRRRIQLLAIAVGTGIGGLVLEELDQAVEDHSH